VQGAGVDPSRELNGCPNFVKQVCQYLLGLDALGYPSADAEAVLRHASVESYIAKVRIPTMLMQGEDDTLFNLHEAVATYTALRAQGTPVKLVWQSWGHSGGTPAPGELGAGTSFDNPDGSPTVEGQMILDWFNHYLKGASPVPALNFSFFRPWVRYSGTDAQAAYASAPRYPIGTPTALHLSGGDTLAPAGAPVAAGAQSFVTPAAGAPTSISEISAISQSVPLFDAPGTYARYETAPLAQATDVVGIPTVRLRVSAPVTALTAAAGPLGDLALFFKLEDIAPGGTATLPDRLISPARFADTGGDVTVSLPGIVHRFAAGDRIALVVAGGDAAYRGGDVATPVTIATSPADPGVLTLPVAGAGSYGPLQDTVAKAHRRPRRHVKRRHVKRRHVTHRHATHRHHATQRHRRATR
jgi:ABC-2 type transport system ATP-binding protein